MPNFSTPSGSTQPYIPAINRDQRNRVPGTVKVFADLAEMAAAIVVERANIAQALPVWFDREMVRLAAEPAPVYRLWTLNGASSNANTIVIGSKAYTATGLVRVTTGAPASGVGTNDDLALDAAAGSVYRKVSGNWVLEGLVGTVDVLAQAPRTGNSTLVQLDSGMRVPVTGTAGITLPTGLLGFNVELLRADAGTLTLTPASGVTLYHNGVVVSTFVVTLKNQWIIVTPGALANEFIVSRNTGA